MGSRSSWGVLWGVRGLMNNTNSASITAPAARTHHRVIGCPDTLAGAGVVAGVALGRRPGDGEVAMKENLPLTG